LIDFGVLIDFLNVAFSSQMLEGERDKWNCFETSVVDQENCATQRDTFGMG